MSNCALDPLGRGIRGDRLIDQVGCTPLVRIAFCEREFPGIELYGKAEWHNPGGSVKDRAALRMVLEAERAGTLGPERSILDATSGNTGIALAWIGAAKGYGVRLVVPGNAGSERKRILAAYGADVIYTDPLGGIDAAIEHAQSLFRERPDACCYLDQYGNAANWEAHYDGTAVEIWEQTEGAVTHFVAGLGTSGTFVGATRRLKALDARVRCVSVEPDGPFHGLEGLKHMASSLVPGIYDASLADESLFVRTEDAYHMARRLAREEGLFVGPSAGAAVAACLEVAAKIPRGERAVIVTVLPDRGDRYLGERFWQGGDNK